MSRLRLERVDSDRAGYRSIEAHPECNVYQTEAWADFLRATQSCEPVIARVLDDDEHVGWFTGSIVRTAGLKVLGSPLPGWTTAYQGFVGLHPSRGHDALLALRSFAFDELRCVHLELMHRTLASRDIPAGWTDSAFSSFELPLRGPDDAPRNDDDLLAGMNQMARRNLRLAQRNGLTAVVDVPHAGFTNALYANLAAAFQRRGQRPAFSASRLEALVEALSAENLLGVEVMLPDGGVAASGLFAGRSGSLATFWMGASRPDTVELRPNELLMWAGIRAWRDRDATVFDFGGGGTYKSKFGGNSIVVPWIRTSRWNGLDAIRSHLAAPLMRYRRRRLS